MKKSFYVYFISLAVLASCNEFIEEGEGDKVAKESNSSDEINEETSEPFVEPGPIMVPDGFEILGEAEGDLNKDGTDEKVIVYNTSREGEMGTERELVIYKLDNNQWSVWQKSPTIIMESEAGGMMGDPFENVEIERGCIVVNHFGGSRFKWNYTHRYRFQEDDFYLIGATSGNGAPCDYWEEFDYNLSNGQVIYKAESENCDAEETVTTVTAEDKFIERLPELPLMGQFSPGANPMDLPAEDKVYYY